MFAFYSARIILVAFTPIEEKQFY